MRKPTVTTNPGANRYTGPGERIVEYSSDAAGPGDGTGPAGGLISFRVVDGKLHVHLYRHDAAVVITVGQADS